jgi:hypothetical protein
MPHVKTCKRTVKKEGAKSDETLKLSFVIHQAFGTSFEKEKDTGTVCRLLTL